MNAVSKDHKKGLCVEQNIKINPESDRHQIFQHHANNHETTKAAKACLPKNVL